MEQRDQKTEETARPAKRRMRAGLAAKLLIAVLVAGAPGIVGFGALDFYAEEARLRDLLQADLSVVAGQKAAGLEEMLRAYALDTMALAGQASMEDLAEAVLTRDRAVITAAATDAQADLENLLDNQPLFREAQYVSEQGVAVLKLERNGPSPTVTLNAALTGRAVWDYPICNWHIEDLARGQLYASGIVLNRRDGAIEEPHTPVALFAMPVTGEDGQRHGFVTVTVLAEPILAALEFREPWREAWLVKPGGWFVYHPDPSKRWGSPRDLGTGHNINENLPPGDLVRITSRGYNWLYVAASVQPLPAFGPGLTLVARERGDAVLGPRVRAIRYRTIMLCAIGLFVPLAAAQLLAVFFLRAVPRLRAATRAVAEGDLSHRVHIDSGDEMQDLAEDFNQMAAALEEYGQLERTMALEKLKDDLIHMIVHDLRTPLTSILTGLKTIQYARYDAELTRELLPNSVSAGETLLGMINDLLDISRMESGIIELDIRDVDVRTVADEAMALVADLAEDKSLSLVRDAPAEPTPACVDPEKLRRVVVNLLGNAIKYSPDGAEVIVRVAGDEATGGVHLVVSDRGPGIPEEYRDRIFDKFGQVDSRKTGNVPSTGLGLTFCKMVVEAHGGRIWVESVVGEGSDFHVDLPRWCVIRPPETPGD